MSILCATAGSACNISGILRRVNPMSYYLGTAAQYSVIGTSIVNTGVSSTNLDIGAAKGTIGGGAAGVVPGYFSGAPITVGGSTHLEDLSAIKAIADVQTAYGYFKAFPPTAGITGDFIGRTYLPGVYSTVEAISCSGAFYVDAENDPSAVFVFIIGGAYTPAAAGRMILKNQARESNIYWCYGGAFSSGAGSTMTGTILTPGAITVGDGATVNGRCLSFGGVVTLANNSIVTS